MKTPVFILAALLGISFSACQPTGSAQKCQQFKNGDFFYYTRNLRGKISFLVNRRGDIQTETNQATGSTSRLAIKWTSDCTYELRFLGTTEHLPAVMDAIRKKAVLKNEIVGSTSDYYIYRASREGAKYPVLDTLWIKK